jgi:hypothetical protein
MCSDYSVPVDSRSPCNSDSCTKYLDDAQLGHWYSQNMLPGYGDKTTPMPIGLDAEYWPHGNSHKVLEVAQLAPLWEARTTLLHVAISANTHFERSTVIEQMSRLPGAVHVSERVDYPTYLQQVANSKFVEAPRGNGIDTHRAWEVSDRYCVCNLLSGFPSKCILRLSLCFKHQPLVKLIA